MNDMCPVRIPRKLHQRVKAGAAKRGMKMQFVAERLFAFLLAYPDKIPALFKK